MKNEGLQAALVAVGCFRHRKVMRVTVKKTCRGKRLRKTDVVDHAGSSVMRDLCRTWIRKARALGWRGSIRAACKRGEHLIE